MSRSDHGLARAGLARAALPLLALGAALVVAACGRPGHVVHSRRSLGRRVTDLGAAASGAGPAALPPLGPGVALDSVADAYADSGLVAPPDSSAGDARAGDTRAARRAILHTVAAYVRASNAGDVPALVRLYTDDALVLPPAHPPIEGRRAIAAFWRRGIDSGLALTPLRVDVHGDVAWVIGRYTLPATEEDPADSGKSVFCLHRGRDGAWRLAADMWSADTSGDAPDADDAADDQSEGSGTHVT